MLIHRYLMLFPLGLGTFLREDSSNLLSAAEGQAASVLGHGERILGFSIPQRHLPEGLCRTLQAWPPGAGEMVLGF